jgi:hypothetical protein
VATIFQQIITYQWGRVGRSQNNGHHENCSKSHAASRFLTNYNADKYNYKYRLRALLAMTATNHATV